VRRRAGTPPGADLLPPPNSPQPRIEALLFDETVCERKEVRQPEDLAALRGGEKVLWVDVNGLGDAETIARVGKVFGFHRLSMEDVLHIDQRPKLEEFADHLFIVVQHPLLEQDQSFEQIALFLGRGFVVTFQAFETNRLEAVRQRLMEGRGRVRGGREDYLAYALLDLVVDAYFPFMEQFDLRLENLETSILGHGSPGAVQGVFDQKRKILQLRRTLWAMRDCLAQMARQPGGMIRAETTPYFRDVQDHVLRILEVAELQRELCTSLLELHHSQLNQRMNEIMKVLTMTATIFIPLSFIAGIYGMNFDPEASPWNMPELGWFYGYPAALMLMLAVAVSMLVFFRRKGWIGAAAREDGDGDL
jgi:magnesium transporter